MPNGEPQREVTGQRGFREIHLAGLIHAGRLTRVQTIEVIIRERQTGRPGPEADDTQRDRCQAFKVGIGVNPHGELPGEADVLGDPRRDAVRTAKRSTIHNFRALNRRPSATPVSIRLRTPEYLSARRCSGVTENVSRRASKRRQ